MARSFKFAATLALSLLLAPSFVRAMDAVKSQEQIQHETNLSAIKALFPNFDLNDVKSLADSDAAVANLRKAYADKLAQDAQTKATLEADAADRAAVAKAKVFNDAFRGGKYSPATLVYNADKDGNPEFSKKWVAIDLAVVAAAITAAYFGTEKGKSGVRWMLSFAPDAVISEEKKLEWAVEKEQLAAKNAEAAKASATKIAQLKAQSEELVARRLAAVQA
jgi:hypothetical protein